MVQYLYIFYLITEITSHGTHIQWCAKLMTIFKIEIVPQQLYQLKHTIYHFKAKKL